MATLGQTLFELQIRQQQQQQQFELQQQQQLRQERLQERELQRKYAGDVFTRQAEQEKQARADKELEHKRQFDITKLQLDAELKGQNARVIELLKGQNAGAVETQRGSNALALASVNEEGKAKDRVFKGLGPDWMEAANQVLGPVDEGMLEAMTPAQHRQVADQMDKNLRLKHPVRPASAGMTVVMQPNEIETMVDSIAAGNQPMPSGRTLTTPFGQKVMARLMEKYPNADATLYGQRQHVVNSLASGKDASALKSGNTAIQHLVGLLEATKTVNNTSVQWVNALKNFALEKGGSDRLRAFETHRKGLAGELGRLFKDIATDKEIEDWKAELTSDQSPKQIRATVKSITQMMLERLGSVLFNAQTFGNKDFQALQPDNVKHLADMLGIKVDPALLGQSSLRAEFIQDFKDTYGREPSEAEIAKGLAQAGL